MHPAQRTASLNALVKGMHDTAPVQAAKAASHGAPARRYLNEKVTGVLLEGMKRLAADRYVIYVFSNALYLRALGLRILCAC